MGSDLTVQGLPQRSPFGHLWRSVVAGALSGTVVGALGSAVGPILGASNGLALPDGAATIWVPVAYAAAFGSVIGLVAGLATMAQRGRFDAEPRRRTAKILALVVAIPGGVLLFATWQISTSSTVLFVTTMVGSVVYCGLATYLTARASLRSILGTIDPADQVSPNVH